MNEFTASDSDFVYRRNPERWIMLAVCVLELFVFVGVGSLVLTKEPEKALPVIILMGAVVLLLAVLTVWLWTYEVRITGYELIVRSVFGGKTVLLSEVVGLERRRVKGKNPPQYNLHVRTSDQQTLKIVDLKLNNQWLHEKLREKCKSLKTTEFVA